MGIFLALLLVLTIISLLMNLSGNSELGKLRNQNNKMREQLDYLQKEYTKLLTQIKEVQEQESSTALVQTTLGKAAVPTGGGAMATQAVTTGVSLEKMDDNQRLDLVKSNIYRMQSILESYALGHGGNYPGSLEELDNYATTHFANEVITNPYSGNQSYITDHAMCIDITSVPADEGIPENAGKLLFQANIEEDGSAPDYTIAAFDGDGLLIRSDDGSIFTISKP